MPAVTNEELLHEIKLLRMHLEALDILVKIGIGDNCAIRETTKTIAQRCEAWGFENHPKAGGVQPREPREISPPSPRPAKSKSSPRPIPQPAPRPPRYSHRDHNCQGQACHHHTRRQTRKSITRSANLALRFKTSQPKQFSGQNFPSAPEKLCRGTTHSGQTRSLRRNVAEAEENLRRRVSPVLRMT